LVDERIKLATRAEKLDLTRQGKAEALKKVEADAAKAAKALEAIKRTLTTDRSAP
jgi:hypothetical protein